MRDGVPCVSKLITCVDLYMYCKNKINVRAVVVVRYSFFLFSIVVQINLICKISVFHFFWCNFCRRVLVLLYDLALWILIGCTLQYNFSCFISIFVDYILFFLFCVIDCIVFFRWLIQGPIMLFCRQWTRDYISLNYQGFY